MSRRYCCEDISSIENYEKAIADKRTWHCHHRKETDENLTNKQLIEMGLYYNRPAAELIFLHPSDHISAHQKGRTPWNKGVPGTEDFRKKMSEVTSGENNPFYGRHHTEETKKKISEAHKGMRLSEETKRRLSEMNKGRNNHFFGKHHSEETRKKWSLKRSGKNNPQYGKRLYNNGIKEAFCFEGQQPEGWVRGKIKRQKEVET